MRSFERWWPELERSIENSIHYVGTQTIESQPDAPHDPELADIGGKNRVIMEEVLNNTRVLMQRVEDLLQTSTSIGRSASFESEREMKKPVATGGSNRGPNFLIRNYKSVERQAIKKLEAGANSESVFSELVSKGVPELDAKHLINENRRAKK